jgi:prepilin-type N-terminal cleavage/methylation domain-containing protein
MKNNKGFSLVELIIVIAIMAILVGVMAPQLIKYIEKSKVSADTQLADSVHTAILTAMMDPEVVNNSQYANSPLVSAGAGSAHDITSGDVVGSAALEILGVSNSTDLASSLRSTKTTGGTWSDTDISWSVLNQNQLSVWINGSDATGSKGHGTNTSVISVK